MSEVKVNKLSPRSGTTVTIGDSGDTVNIVGTLQNNGAAIPGDISSVVAGTGLSGGGTSGDVTLNVEAAQSGITSLGTITGFTSTGIDDNATSTAITISSDERVTIDADDEKALVVHHNDGSIVRIGMNNNSTNSNEIAFDSTDFLVKPGGTERMRIDSSGKVGIGETSMDALLVIKGDSDENTTPSIRLKDGSDSREAWITNTAGDLYLTTGGDDNTPHTQLRMLNGDIMAFRTANTERLRIDSNGSVLIGTTSEPTGSTGGAGFINDSSSRKDLICASTSTGTIELIEFRNPNGTVGVISTSGSNTNYGTSSDYRLKENVVEIEDATARLKKLKPKRFNFIADANTTVDGFIAHEVSSVVPEAISGEKDAVKTKEKVVINSNGEIIANNIEQADWEVGKIADENGNTQYPTDSTWEATKVVPVYQGIDQSKLVPLLVKTIQELEARITTLENA